MIPLCDLKQQYLGLKHEIDRAMIAVAEQGQYILGPSVQALEREIASYLGCRHAIGVGNGTDALQLALRALDIGPGDEVITTPLTFIASSEAICLVGATPVFVDVDPFTFNIDLCQVEAAITSRTKAIIPVHLYGQPCDMDAILAIAEKHSIQVVEDCAQAIGASYKGKRVGTFGSAGCFSFFPTKNLGGFGDGGMIVTNDAALYERIEKLRRHGATQKYVHRELGLNSRLDELQAVILRVKLPHLDEFNERRRQCAYRYNELLSDCPGVERPAELTSHATAVPVNNSPANGLLRAVYHQYTILAEDRNAVQTALTDAGIGSAVYYPVPLHLQPAHANLGYRPGDFPVAEAICNTCLSLPMFPELTESQLTHIAGTMRKCAVDSGEMLRITRPKSNSVAQPLPQPVSEFSQDDYVSLLQSFLEAGYVFREFSEADAAMRSEQPFVLLRHDIDMDLERALQIAEAEAELGIRATYFVLLRTEHYNVLSERDSNYLKAILDLGHQLGLHFDCAAYPAGGDGRALSQLVNREAQLLGDWFGRKISIVSFHRPAPDILAGGRELSEPLEHTYLPEFTQHIHYSSDSGGRFRYGHPLSLAAFAQRRPIQLLTHPIWWGAGESAAVELERFVDRRQSRIRQSLAENCKVRSASRTTAVA